uniref:Uncharacterized protein n=1 Tax=Amphimedon queenslandica TaxID=400682 RepID=A0A1X7VIZ7_AMPQE
MIVRKEMKDICSDSHDSIICDSNEGVRNFSCVSLLLLMMPGKDDGIRVMLLGVIVPMMLKKRYPKMALLQRALSVLLYGNGFSKEVYNCLQPLMVSLSYTGKNKLIKCLSEDHDIKVPLGVLLKNENKVDKMCQIMDSVHKYVPTQTEDKKVTLCNGEQNDLQHTEM